MSPRQQNHPGLQFNPDRETIIAEAHARPSLQMDSPAQILHIAFRSDSHTSKRFFDTLGQKTGETGARHLFGRIGEVKVKLERHTEFVSCTLFKETGKGKSDTNLLAFLSDTFPVSDIEIMVLLKLTLHGTLREMLKALPMDQRVYGGKIRDQLDVRSGFTCDEDGVMQFHLHAKTLTRDELGRRIQRLLEMETYRTMSLLGLQLARRVSGDLAKCEMTLDRLSAAVRQTQNGQSRNEEAVFQELSNLSEQTNLLLAETRYRFAASRAYYALFQQRVKSLEEEKVGDVQTMSGFLLSRMEPAMATIESTALRQQTLTEDISRALVLLRTRIELNLNRGNQALLRSMDKRHQQQLKISQTVEGLSVVAISYYAVGLLSYLFDLVEKHPAIPLSGKILTAFSVPVVVFLVWYSIRKLRAHWEDR